MRRVTAALLGLVVVTTAPRAPAAAPAPAPAEPADERGGRILIDNQSLGAPAHPPRGLQTVRLQPKGDRGRPPERPASPVDRAPRLPSLIELKEPDPEQLARLEAEAAQAAQAAPAVQAPGRAGERAAAERGFAEAVSLLNRGEYAVAQSAFLSFAARNPRHTAADSALYYAGLARAAGGDCAGAVSLYERLLHDYPAGTALEPAQLERGRCLLRSGQTEKGRDALARIVSERPGSTQAQQARLLLDEAR
jgi:TolA-binding protein